MASCTRFYRLAIGLPRRQPSVYRCVQTSAISQSQNTFYPLFPSVSQLLHEKGIPLSDVPKIPASGPRGRLLKGDVLSYTGAIPADYSSSQSERIRGLQHLDLGNVKVPPPPKASAPAPGPAPAPEPASKPAPEPTPEPTPEPAPEPALGTAPEPTTGPAPAETKPAPPPPPPEPKETEVSVSVSLSPVLSTQKRIQESLGVTIPLSTFLARATDLANDDLPRSKSAVPSPDELFDQLVGEQDPASLSTSRGDFMPEISNKPPGTTAPSVSASVSESGKSKKTRVEKEDIIDILSGKPHPPQKPARKHKVVDSGITTSGDSAVNVFSLTVPEGDEKRAKVFLERVKTVLQVNPGSLVL